MVAPTPPPTIATIPPKIKLVETEAMLGAIDAHQVSHSIENRAIQKLAPKDVPTGSTEKVRQFEPSTGNCGPDREEAKKQEAKPMVQTDRDFNRNRNEETEAHLAMMAEASSRKPKKRKSNEASDKYDQPSLKINNNIMHGFQKRPGKNDHRHPNNPAGFASTAVANFPFDSGRLPLEHRSLASDLQASVNAFYALTAAEAGLPSGSAPSGRRLSFPEKLMELLASDDARDSMCWLPSGNAFALQPAVFTKKILPHHFEGTKFESFTRKLNRWGFKRVTGEDAPDNSFAYYHHLFKREFPELCRGMSGGKKLEKDLSHLIRRDRHNDQLPQVNVARANNLALLSAQMPPLRQSMSAAAMGGRTFASGLQSNLESILIERQRRQQSLSMSEGEMAMRVLVSCNERQEAAERDLSAAIHRQRLTNLMLGNGDHDQLSSPLLREGLIQTSRIPEQARLPNSIAGAYPVGSQGMTASAEIIRLRYEEECQRERRLHQQLALFRQHQQGGRGRNPGQFNPFGL